MKKKLLIVLTVFVSIALIVGIIASFLMCQACCVYYDGRQIGYMDGSCSADDVKASLSGKLAGDGGEKDRITEKEVPFSYFKKLKTADEIADEIIKQDSDIVDSFCLVAGGKVCYEDADRGNVLRFLNDTLSGIKESFSGEEYFILADYRIAKGYCKRGVSYSDAEMKKLLNIMPATYKTRTENSPVPFTVEYQYLEREYNLNKESDIIRQGVNGMEQVGYTDVYAGGIYMYSKYNGRVTMMQPVSELHYTSDMKRATAQETRLDASILGLDDLKTSFLNELLPSAQRGFKEHNVPVSLTLAQAILESNWGQSAIGHNIYGIKAFGWQGKTVSTLTTEFQDGEPYRCEQVFRDYNSLQESVDDYIALLSTDLYAGVRNAGNYKEAAYAVKAAGYATSPEYAESLITIIETYKLYTWDVINHKV